MRYERFSIAYATNHGFWEHACISIYSLLVNNQTLPLDIYVLVSSVGERLREDQAFLESIHPDAEIHWICVSDSVFSDAPTNDGISKESYYRLMLGTLLPESVRRVLYLDGDILIRRELRRLLDLDLRGHVLAACYQPDEAGKTPHAERLGMPEHTPYFNAGVLVLDLDKWRSEQLEGQCLKYVYDNLSDPIRLQYHDQDTLNVLLAGNWLDIGPTYNFHRWTYDPARFGFGAELLPELETSGPVIAHFAGPIKPWDGGSRHPSEKEYWSYRMRTPYADRKLMVRSRLVAVPRGILGIVLERIRRQPWLYARLLGARSALARKK